MKSYQFDICSSIVGSGSDRSIVISQDAKEPSNKSQLIVIHPDQAIQFTNWILKIKDEIDGK